jgi:hypothetical protein
VIFIYSIEEVGLIDRCGIQGVGLIGVCGIDVCHIIDGVSYRCHIDVI